MTHTPKSILVDPEDSGKVYRQIDDFFVQTKEEIEGILRIDKNKPSHFEIKVNGLYREPNIFLDDCIHILLYKEKVAAVVTETRNSTNYVQFNFFKNLEGIID